MDDDLGASTHARAFGVEFEMTGRFLEERGLPGVIIVMEDEKTSVRRPDAGVRCPRATMRLRRLVDDADEHA